MKNIFIGRQPIYSQDLKVFAYELLFRETDQKNEASFKDGDSATTQVIFNALIEIGLDQIVGERPAFFNMTRNYLLASCPLPFSEKRIVLEVLENITPDQELLAALRSLSEKGYTLALDDFVFQEELSPLVDIVEIVKIDISATSREDLRWQVEKLRQYPVQLLAEKVETQDEYDFCQELGFDLYQGYFFCKPRIIVGKRIPTNKIAIMRLLAKINDPNLNLGDLEEEISQDVSLSYRLLKTVNSAFFALPRKVESIHEAIAYIGLQTTRDLATLLALSGFDDKPLELMKTALVRAKFCEKIGGLIDLPNYELFFTVGLFSVLDALMDSPMETILKDLPVSEDIVDALLHREGPSGEILAKALAYERGDWGNVPIKSLEPKEIMTAYIQALQWAEKLFCSLDPD